jgi:hypothetical protein
MVRCALHDSCITDFLNSLKAKKAAGCFIRRLFYSPKLNYSSTKRADC